MSCEAIRPLLHAHVDGELDLVREIEVERHLASCPACTRACRSLQALQSALRSMLPPIETPPGLAGRIRAALRTAATPPTPPRPLWRRPGLPLAAAVLLAVAAWFLFHDGPFFPWWDHTPEEVTASCQRFQMSPHLDVESSDPERVQAGLQAKLLFAPHVLDLSEQGYTLSGGRVDFVNQRPVAALEYKHAGHVLSVLTWPAEPGTGPQPLQTTDCNGFHLIRWAVSGRVFWAVSDLDEADLLHFAELFRQNTPITCH